MVPVPAVNTLMTALFRVCGSVDLVWENAGFVGSGPPFAANDKTGEWYGEANGTGFGPAQNSPQRRTKKAREEGSPGSSRPGCAACGHLQGSISGLLKSM
jgi:hypothetical protein